MIAAAADFDIQLGEYGFMIEPGSLVRSDLTAAIPRVAVATESKKRSDFSELDTLGQFTWNHGRGQYLFSDPAGYMEGQFVDTRVSGQAIPAPAQHQSFKTGGVDPDLNGQANDFTFTLSIPEKLLMLVGGTVVGDNRLYTWNEANEEWDALTGADALLQAANSQPWRLHTFSKPTAVPPALTTTNFILSGRRLPGFTNGLDYIYSIDDGTTWAAGPAAGNGSKASTFATFKERLAFDVSNSAVVLRPDPTTNVGDILINNLGSSEEPITSIVVLGDVLVVFKMGSAYVIEYIAATDTYVSRPVINYRWAAHINNGLAAIEFNGSILFNVQQSVYEFSGTSLRSVGPDLGATEAGTLRAGLDGTIEIPPQAASSQGMNQDKRGTFLRFTRDSNWVYGVMYPGDFGGDITTIMAYQGTGWHELSQLPAGLNSNVVALIPVLDEGDVLANPTLWLGRGEESWYMSLAPGTDNRYDYTAVDYHDQNSLGVATNPYLISSWFDADLPEVDKDWLELYTNADFPDTTLAALAFYVQTDYDDTWYLVGGVHNTNAGTPRIRLQNLGGVGNGIRAKAIRYKVEWYGEQGAVTPLNDSAVRMKGVFFRFITRPQPRYGWVCTVHAREVLDLIDQVQSVITGEELARRLYDLRSRAEPLRFDDGRAGPAGKNLMLNPSFEAWSSGIPKSWVAVNTGTASKYSIGSYRGRLACRITAPGGTTGAGIETTTSPINIGVVQNGPHYAVVRMVPGFHIWRVQLYKNGVAQGFVDVSSQTAEAGLPIYQRVVVPFTVADWTVEAFQWRLRITNVTGHAILPTVTTVDACEIREGVDDQSPYIDLQEPRCFPFGLSGHAQKFPFWLVYVSAVSEGFQVPVRDKDPDTGEDRLTYQTAFRLELREAW